MNLVGYKLNPYNNETFQVGDLYLMGFTGGDFVDLVVITVTLPDTESEYNAFAADTLDTTASSKEGWNYHFDRESKSEDLILLYLGTKTNNPEYFL